MSESKTKERLRNTVEMIRVRDYDPIGRSICDQRIDAVVALYEKYVNQGDTLAELEKEVENLKLIVKYKEPQYYEKIAIFDTFLDLIRAKKADKGENK